MRLLTHCLLVVFAATAFAQRENLQRGIGTNTIVGTSANAPFRVATIAALKATTIASVVANSQIVEVAGYLAAGDGGGGVFQYSSASAATDNGGTIIAPNTGTGRWLRVYSDWLNVKWFGATGDGTTNDTSALQASLDAIPAVGGKIIIPAGTYLITGAGLTVSKPTTIQGAGWGRHGENGATVLKYTGIGECIEFTAISQGGAELSDIQINGDTNINPGVAGVYINGPSGTLIRKVFVRGIAGTVGNRGVGIRVYTSADATSQSYFTSIVDSYINACGKGILLDAVTSGAANTPNMTTLRNTSIVGCSSHGVEMAASNINNLTMFGGSTAYNGGWGVLVAGYNNLFVGVDIEGNSSGGMDVQTDSAVTGTTAIGCPGLKANGINGALTVLDNEGFAIAAIDGAACIKQQLRGSVVWDPGIVADGATTSVEITVTGAETGDFVQVTFPMAGNLNVLMTGHVSGANTVRLVLFNKTGGNLDLASGTAKSIVSKPAF